MVRTFLIAICLISSTYVQATTLKEALDAARTHNATLQASTAALKSQQAIEEQARSNLRPSLSATGSLYDSEQEQSGITTDLHPSTFILEARQNLFSGGDNFYGLSREKARTASQQASLFDTTQKILTQTVDAYVDVLVASHLVDLQESQVNLLSQQYKATQLRFEQGDVTMTDIKQAEARVSAAKAAHVEAVGSRDIAASTFSALYGKTLLDPVWPEQIPIFEKNLIDHADEAIKKHPQLIAAKETLRAAEKAHLQNRGGFLPTIDFVAQHRLNDTDNTENTTDNRVGVEMTWSLIQGGRNFAKRSQSAADISAAKQTLLQTMRDLKRNLLSTFYNLATAQSVLDARQIEEKASSRAKIGVEKEYLLGRRTLLDVLDAENELLASRVSLITARGDVIKASYALKAAIGELHQ